MKNILVLGAGMVGSAMAIDLAQHHRVTLTDLNIHRLRHVKERCHALSVVEADVTDAAHVRSLVQPFDLVMCAVPGFLGYAVLRSVIEAGKNVVDISFFSENALELDPLAKEKGVTAVVDCGVAPGMANILLGHYDRWMNLTDYECLVGGLPIIKKWPSFYKAPFSPADVIEEYTRPARFVENGRVVVREALTDCELVHFEKLGTLESFNTDGLRSLILTMPHIRNMKEKTLRYPGHVEFIRALKESGFFSKKPLNVHGHAVAPLDLTSRVLFDEWKLGENEPEVTVMRITMNGTNEKGEPEKIVYDLYDEFDAETQTTSMARTTGYTATAAANLLLDGLFNERGVFPPELIGKKDDCFEYIFQYLGERNVRCIRKG